MPIRGLWREIRRYCSFPKQDRNGKPLVPWPDRHLYTPSCQDYRSRQHPLPARWPSPRAGDSVRCRGDLRAGCRATHLRSGSLQPLCLFSVADGRVRRLHTLPAPRLVLENSCNWLLQLHAPVRGSLPTIHRCLVCVLAKLHSISPLPQLCLSKGFTCALASQCRAGPCLSGVPWQRCDSKPDGTDAYFHLFRPALYSRGRTGCTLLPIRSSS